MSLAQYTRLAACRLGLKRIASSRLLPAVRCGLAAAFVVAFSTRLLAEERGEPQSTAEKQFQPAIASPEDIHRWISELSHETFTVRQSAASQLLAAGMSAREPLLAIAEGPDPETRAAARRLVSLIDQSEFHRRLEAFAADTEGRQGISLPGWDQFQKLVGSDPPARALFVDMQRQEGALLAVMFGVSRRTPSELLESRLKRLIQWQNVATNRVAMPPIGSCAALLFLGSVAEIEVTDTAANYMEGLLQRPPIVETLRANNREDPVRRLVVGWVLHCTSKNEEILRRRLDLISTLGMKEALPLALTVIRGESPFKRVHPFTRAQATLVVGQFGGREHVDVLEPLLEDTSPCAQAQLPGQVGATVQVRDVALVMMLHLTGQNPADYGYTSARPQTQPARLYTLQGLFRENNQQRLDAITKWRQWRAGQKELDALEKKSEEK